MLPRSRTLPRALLAMLGAGSLIAGLNWIGQRRTIDGKLFGAAFAVTGLGWLARAATEGEGDTLAELTREGQAQLGAEGGIG